MRELLIILLIAGHGWCTSVRDFKAKGDGSSKDTAAIQAAIEAASQQGGGVVFFPAGVYLSGTIHLKSQVTLDLAPGAVIMASPDEGDFDPYEKLEYESHADKETTYFHYALIAAEGATNIAIVGQGVVDGNRTKRGGPKTISIKTSSHIEIRGITVRNAPNYSISFLGCDYVLVDGVTILNGYADGIDPDCSRFVRISNCFVESRDDAICPKTSLALGRRRSTENVTVTNCVLSSSANNFKLGTESSGDFKNIVMSNCVMFRMGDERRATSGIAIESVDGSNIDGVAISNVTMRDMQAPIFIRLGSRGRGLNPPAPGSVANISISNIVATGSTRTSSVTGLPGHPVRGVNLDNIRISSSEASKVAGDLKVPENPDKYPESPMFGTLPAHGFYVRHVEDVTLRNVRTRLQGDDARPALVFDDVKDLDLDGFSGDTNPGQPMVWLNAAKDAFVHGSKVPVSAGGFLRQTGGSKAVEAGNGLLTP